MVSVVKRSKSSRYQVPLCVTESPLTFVLVWRYLKMTLAEVEHTHTEATGGEHGRAARIEASQSDSSPAAQRHRDCRNAIAAVAHPCTHLMGATWVLAARPDMLGRIGLELR